MDRDVSQYEKYAPHAVVAVIFAYMAWIRTLPYSDAFGEDGSILFSANDPWYHIRTTEYLVENYPATFSFDPWTYFPYGSATSTGFGGLFNQIIATVAVIVGLGSPSSEQVEIIAAFAPVFFGAATAVPVYLLAKKLTDRWVALLGALALALFTGQFLNRTTFGNVQHQSAEAFFVAVAVLGFVVAVDRAYAEKPTLAHVKDKDWRAFSGAIIGGVALAAYVLTWPPAIYIVVPFGLFVVVQMVRDYLNDDSTEYLAFTAFFVFVVAAVPVFIYMLLHGFYYRVSGTGLSLLQPFALAGTGVGALFLHYVGDYLRSEEIDKAAFPAVIGALALVAVVVLWLTGLLSLFESLAARMYTFGALAGEGALTVAEIQPAGIVDAIGDFGLLILVAAAGLVILAVDVVRENRPAETAVLFWSINMFTAYFTQARFGYYLAVAAAVLVAYGVFRIVELADLQEASFESLEDVKEVKGYQLIALVLIVFMFVPVTVVGIGDNPQMQPAWDSVQAGGDEPWQEDALPWMNENTPEVPMEYNEPVPIPEGEDFDYPVDESPLEGAYGVMSWWDYGHWITHVGERVPNANPFQQGNIGSSLFFTSQSEERADLLVEALPSVEGGSALEGMSDDQLRDIIAEQDDQERYEDTRYVMIDDQMAAGKFGAIATWTGFGEEEPYIDQRDFRIGEDEDATQALPALGDEYDQTTLSRLYYDDADEMDGYRLVHETETYALIGSLTDLSQPLQINRLFNRAQYNDPEALGGTTLAQAADLPDDQMIPAGGGTYLYDIRAAASVKTYERVEGATITGEANVSEPANVTAFVEMETTNTDRTFPYTDRVETDADGEFEITVPYSTVDDVPVEEGGTNASVEATGPYEVYVGNVGIAEIFGETQVVGEQDEAGEVNVSETDVYMGNEVEVELEEVEEPDENETANETDLEDELGDVIDDDAIDEDVDEGDATDGVEDGGNAEAEPDGGS